VLGDVQSSSSEARLASRISTYGRRELERGGRDRAESTTWCLAMCKTAAHVDLTDPRSGDTVVEVVWLGWPLSIEYRKRATAVDRRSRGFGPVKARIAASLLPSDRAQGFERGISVVGAVLVVWSYRAVE